MRVSFHHFPESGSVNSGSEMIEGGGGIDSAYSGTADSVYSERAVSVLNDSFDVTLSPSFEDVWADRLLFCCGDVM